MKEISNLVGKSSEKILDFILSKIESENVEDDTSEIEDDLYEEPTHLRKKVKRKSSDLKIFVVKNYGITVNEIKKALDELYFESELCTNKIFRSFIDKYPIEQMKLNQEYEYFSFTNKNTFQRIPYFIFHQRSHFWLFFTFASKSDVERTLDNVIKYIPDLELVRLTSRNLEDLAKSEQFNDSINGFIAKYRPFYKKRKITVNVYGGTLDDLNKIRNVYFVEPDSVNFVQRNSPITAGKISSGYFSLEACSKGEDGIKFAKKIISDINSYFIQIDNSNFEEITKYENRLIPTKNSKCLTFTPSSHIVFNIKDERFDNKRDDSIDFNQLESYISQFLERYKKRYLSYKLQKDSFNIFDKSTHNSFHLSIERKHRNVIISPYGKCKDITFRDFTHYFTERIESSIESIKTRIKA